MNFQTVTTVSKWSPLLKHTLCTQDSDTLIIALPGQGYAHDKPLFYYLVSLAQTTGFDLFNISYGFQASKASFHKEELPILVLETNQALSTLDLTTYQRVIIIAKSLGTFLAQTLYEALIHLKPHLDIQQILLTPLSASTPNYYPVPTLVIYGTSDDLLDTAARTRVHLNATRTEAVKGADHSLLIGQITDDLSALTDVYGFMAEFLKNPKSDLGLTAKQNLYLTAVTPEDYPLLADTLIASDALYRPLMGDAFLKLAAKYRQTGPANPLHYWCIRTSKNAIGFVAFEGLTDSCAYLIGLYLLPDFIGQRIGTQEIGRAHV